MISHENYVDELWCKERFEKVVLVYMQEGIDALVRSTFF